MDLKGLTSIPIFGGRSIEQLNENVGALDMTLSDEQYYQIAQAGMYSGLKGSPYIYTDG